MVTRRGFFGEASRWPALLMARPFNGLYDDGHIHTFADIQGPTGNLTIEGDIRSFNWAGGSSVPDTAATTGYYGDSSLGAWQMEALWLVRQSSGVRFIGPSGAGTHGQLAGGLSGSRERVFLATPVRTGSEELIIEGFDFLSGTDAADDPVFRAMNVGLFGFEVLADHTMRWAVDTDTYWKRTADDQQSFFSGGVEMLRLAEAAEDVVTVGPSSAVSLRMGSGFFGFGTQTEITVSAGAVTATQSYHLIDTEADAATDDLDTINGGSSGDLLIVTSADAARDTTVRDNGVAGGNIFTAGSVNYTLSTPGVMMGFVKLGGGWRELFRSAT